VRAVWTGELLELSVTVDGRGAWLARTERSSRGVALDELEELRRAIEALPAERMALVIDLRRAPGRNDPDFEEKLFPTFRTIVSRFPRQATLVKSEVGKMQVRRLDEAARTAIFTDEAEALRFVAG
jgi:hypothetical protein